LDLNSFKKLISKSIISKNTGISIYRTAEIKAVQNTEKNNPKNTSVWIVFQNETHVIGKINRIAIL